MSSNSCSTISLSTSGQRVRTYRWRYLQLIKDGLIWLTGKRTRAARASDSARSVPECSTASASHSGSASLRKTLRFKNIRTRSTGSIGRSRSSSIRSSYKRSASGYTKSRKAGHARKSRSNAKGRKSAAYKRGRSGRSRAQRKASCSKRRTAVSALRKLKSKPRVAKCKQRKTTISHYRRAATETKMTKAERNHEVDLKRLWSASQDLLVAVPAKKGKGKRSSESDENLAPENSRYCLTSDSQPNLVKPQGTKGRKKSTTSKTAGSPKPALKSARPKPTLKAAASKRRGRPVTKGRSVATRSLSTRTRVSPYEPYGHNTSLSNSTVPSEFSSRSTVLK
ncbi:hypothetical protein ACOMHN_008694 [Nucella lapillus]